MAAHRVQAGSQPPAVNNQQATIAGHRSGGRANGSAVSAVAVAPPPALPTPAEIANAAADAGNYSLKRSEEHTSELQSQSNLVCRLLLEKKKTDPWAYRYKVTS